MPRLGFLNGISKNRAQKKPKNLGELPPEMLLRIFSHMSCFDAAKARGVCQTFKEVAEAPALWDVFDKPVKDIPLDALERVNALNAPPAAEDVFVGVCGILLSVSFGIYCHVRSAIVEEALKNLKTVQFFSAIMEGNTSLCGSLPLSACRMMVELQQSGCLERGPRFWAQFFPGLHHDLLRVEHDVVAAIAGPSFGMAAVFICSVKYSAVIGKAARSLWRIVRDACRSEQPTVIRLERLPVQRMRAVAARVGLYPQLRAQLVAAIESKDLPRVRLFLEDLHVPLVQGEQPDLLNKALDQSADVSLCFVDQGHAVSFSHVYKAMCNRSADKTSTSVPLLGKLFGAYTQAPGFFEQFGERFLKFAVQNQDTEFAGFILKAMPDKAVKIISQRRVERFGNLFQLAALTRQEDMYNLFLQAGADPHLRLFKDQPSAAQLYAMHIDVHP